MFETMLVHVNVNVDFNGEQCEQTTKLPLTVNLKIIELILDVESFI